VSLVSEALKKAEREAAAREARAKGLPPPLESPLQPYRARRRARGGRTLAPVLALLGGAAAIALAILLARPAIERAASKKVEAAAVSAAAAAPAPTKTSLPAAGFPQVAAAIPVPPISPVTPVTYSAPSARESIPAQQPTLSLQQTTSPPPRQAPSASEAPSPRTAVPPASAGGRNRDVLRRVDFPDGTKLELGGIVYSEAAPFAYLNGRLVGVGELVEGFRIDRIERERVFLSGEAGAITIRLKGP